MTDELKPHKILNGEVVLLTDEEIAAEDARAAEWQAGACARSNASILAQIASLELGAVMPRALRDMILSAGTANAAYAKTKDLDDQIAALRAKLV